MAQFPPTTERGVYAVRVVFALCFLLSVAAFAPMSDLVGWSGLVYAMGAAMIGILYVWWERISDRPVWETPPVGRSMLYGGIAGLVGITLVDHYPTVFWSAVLGYSVVLLAESLQWLLARQDWRRVTNFG